MKTTKLKWQTDSEGTWLAALVSRQDAMFAMQNVEEGKTYEVEIKRAKGQKRSLDANAYAWVLMDKLAAHNNVRVTDVYRTEIKEIGGNSEVVCIRNEAVEMFRKNWERNGIGWLTEAMPSKIEGCTNIKIYYGSSTYDTAQMSRLIDAIVEDCKEAGIETLQPEELERLQRAWDSYGGK